MLGHRGFPLSPHFNLHISRQEQLFLRLVLGFLSTCVGWWVQLLYVQSVSSFLWASRLIHLQCLRTISLLRFEFSSFVPAAPKWIIKQWVTTLRSLHNGLSCWIKSEVGLIHQLFIEGWVHNSVVHLTSDLVGVAFEKLSQNLLLLIAVNADRFPLNSGGRNSKPLQNIQTYLNCCLVVPMPSSGLEPLGDYFDWFFCVSGSCINWYYSLVFMLTLFIVGTPFGWNLGLFKNML